MNYTSFINNVTAEEKQEIVAKVKELSILNPVRSFSSIIFNWIIIFSIAIISLHVNNLFFYFLSILILGARQHALLLIMHDAAHYRLAKSRKINDWISDLFCAFPLFITTNKYRDSHLAHHTYLNTDLDPDWQLKKGMNEWKFPKTKIYMVLLFLKHLIGLTSFNFIQKLYRFGLNNKTATKLTVLPRSYKIIRISYYVILVSIMSIFHLWTAFLLLWILPAFTVLAFLLRLRGIAEHFGLPWENELDNARNVNVNILERFFISPHSANYHLDHHLFPGVPFYNLKRLHHMLAKNSFYSTKAVNSDGYLRPNSNSVFSAITD